MKMTLQVGIIYLAFLLSTLSASSAHASRWPSFLVPDETFLISNNHIETRHCPEGQGRAHPGTEISVKALCRSYCPPSWVWQIKSDGACHDLASGFTFQGYDVVHHPDDQDDDDGSTLYSVITARYGEKGSDAANMELVFTTPKEHWYCAKDHPDSEAISCANDI
jgi:hypothetical protein